MDIWHGTSMGPEDSSLFR